jgi:hypothetical protein
MDVRHLREHAQLSHEVDVQRIDARFGVGPIDIAAIGDGFGKREQAIGISGHDGSLQLRRV